MASLGTGVPDRIDPGADGGTVPECDPLAVVWQL